MINKLEFCDLLLLYGSLEPVCIKAKQWNANTTSYNSLDTMAKDVGENNYYNLYRAVYALNKLYWVNFMRTKIFAREIAVDLFFSFSWRVLLLLLLLDCCCLFRFSCTHCCIFQYYTARECEKERNAWIEWTTKMLIRCEILPWAKWRNESSRLHGKWRN